MLIRNPSIPNVDRKLLGIEKQIENLELKDKLTDSDRNELKN